MEAIEKGKQEYDRQYYIAHREEHRLAARKYRAGNKEKLCAKSRAYYAANREKSKAATRRWAIAHPDRIQATQRRSKFGMSAEFFANLLAAQGGRCAICGCRMDKPCVDHDHVTGRVRGLLCNNCNAGLGFFQDDVPRMRSALAYLAVHSGRRVA
jgi:hypothetical protein